MAFVKADMEGNLLRWFREKRSAVVAFSGGVDSAVLAKAAVLAVGSHAVAVTMMSELFPAAEEKLVKSLAKEIGIRHIKLPIADLEIQGLFQNGRERCYFCKENRFRKLLDWAKERGFSYVMEGSNIDDSKDYRPGMRALKELSRKEPLSSPFLELGWTKADIRNQAKLWGLSVWNKPSAACLASRVAYGIPLSAEVLSMVERAEDFLRTFLKGQFRVRHHGDLARIEVPDSEVQKVLRQRTRILSEFQAIGYHYIGLDLAGYRMGSQNEGIFH